MGNLGFGDGHSSTWHDSADFRNQVAGDDMVTGSILIGTHAASQIGNLELSVQRLNAILAGWPGEFHEQAKMELAKLFANSGLTVATEVTLVMPDGIAETRADITVQTIDGYTSIIDVKTGVAPVFTLDQMIVYPHVESGWKVYSPNKGISAFGFGQGNPLPPMPVYEYYQQNPGSAHMVTRPFQSFAPYETEIMKIISRAKKSQNINASSKSIPELLMSFDGVAIIDDDFSVIYASYIIRKIFGDAAYNAMKPLRSVKSEKMYTVRGSADWRHSELGMEFEGPIVVKISATNGQILDVRYEAKQILPSIV